MLNSPICDMLGISRPVFQGGMAWVADASLAAAVSNAGALGIIAAMNLNGEQLRQEIKKARELTDRPFGVNLMLMSPYIGEAVDAVIDERVKVVTTGAGNPGKYMERFREAGIKVIPVVASTALAKMMERAGASAVVAEGCESGGHVGETTTMALIPQVADAVSIPVIAAGGIADGRGMAAALMLGASGVQMGTRFLTASECGIHENYKKAVLSAGDISTIVTGKKSGHPVRCLKNRMTRTYARAELDGSLSEKELADMTIGSLRRAVRDGDASGGSMMCGQIAGLVRDEKPAESIVTEVCDEAENLLKGAEKWVKQRS